MNVHERRDYFMSILMFKCIHGLAPDYFMQRNNHACKVKFQRTTRSLSSLNVHVPYAYIECLKKKFLCL